MIRVLSVLKTGGPYDAEYVFALREGVRRCLLAEHEFYCLTDDPALLWQPWAVFLKHGLPGWWSKLELFRQDLPIGSGPRFYFDLDTVLVAPFSMGLPERFAMLPGFGGIAERRASGIMSWSGDEDLSFLLNRYLSMDARPGVREGDQEFIWGEYLRRTKRMPLDLTKELGGVVSYKKHVAPTGKLPSAAKVVCFHGRPRPKEVSDLSWMRESWVCESLS